MSLFVFAMRHLHRHWRVNLLVLLGLTLATALLASLPSYAAAIAARELDQDVNAARAAERNLLITGSRYTFNDALYARLQTSLGAFFNEQMVVRQDALEADPLAPQEQAEREIITTLDVYSFDPLAGHVRLVAGRLPNQLRLRDAEPHRPAPIEAVIGARAAQRSGYGIGDRLTANKAYHRLDIVGIIEPLDVADDVWENDLQAFDLTLDTSDPNVDRVTLPLIIAPASMRSNFKMVPIFWHSAFWRVIINHQHITPDNAPALHTTLVNLQTQLSTIDATVSTGLVQMLADYQTRLSLVRTTLYLLTAQAFFFVLYTLATLTSFLLERSQGELATLAGRGASAGQVLRLFGWRNLILALPAALLLGPGLAQGGLRFWAVRTGETVPATLPVESWLLAGLAAGLAWLALVIPVHPSAQRSLLEWQGLRARPPRLSVAQELYLDLFLLAIGALLYWQLSQSGSFVTRRLQDSQLADPLLLIGPSLLLVAVAMLFLRLFPFLLQGVAWVVQALRGLTLPLGLHRLARDPLKSSRTVLLISLTASLVLFTTTFVASLSYSQDEMAHYLAGADLRISLDQPPPWTVDQLASQPGVHWASPVVRTTARADHGQTLQLLAVDPATFDQVARYPASLTDLDISSVMRALQPPSAGTESDADPLPAVLSFSALPDHRQAGDILYLSFAGQRHAVQVRGIIANFPTLSGPFVILSWPALEARAGPEARQFGTREAWLAVDPAGRDALERMPGLDQRLLDDAQAHLRAFQADALARGVSGAFQLNTLTLAMLSVTALLLVHYFAARGRALEFGVLRALGLSLRQLVALLVTEGLLVIALGLAMGTLIGYGMARVMIPYLSQAISEALAGISIEKILFDWAAIARFYLILTACYGLALLLLLAVLLRAGVHHVLRIGDE